jgi:hypothetical protein
MIVNKKRVIIISLVIILSLAIAAFFIRKNIHNKIIQTIQNKVTHIIKDGELSYDEVKIKGLFLPKQITFINAAINNSYYRLTSKKANLDLNKNDNYLLSSHESTFYIKNSQQKNKTTTDSQIISKDTISIKLQNNGLKQKLTVILPQKLLVKSIYNSGVFIYNQPKPILTYNLENNKLTDIYYSDNGAKTYDLDNQVVSSHEEAIVNINKDTQQELWQINATLNRQKFLNKTSDKQNLDKELNILLNATYINSTKEKQSFHKNLNLNSLSLKYGNWGVNFTAKLTQDHENLVPYGTANLTINNYKLMVKSFYQKFSKVKLNADLNIPTLKNIQKNSQKLTNNTLEFLQRINNVDSDILTIDIKRDSKAMPYINNMLINKIIDMYQQIYNIE